VKQSCPRITRARALSGFSMKVRSLKNNSEYEIAHQNKDGKEQSVSAHLIAVSTIARASADKVGLPLTGELCGLLHDLGKYSQEFQNYINSALGNIDPDAEEYVDANGKKGKIDHSTAGAQLVWQKLQDGVYQNDLAAQIISLSIVSHHSGLIDCISPDGLDKFSNRIKKDYDKTHYWEAIKKCDTKIIHRINEIVSTPEFKNELTAAEKRIKRVTKTTHSFQQGLFARFVFSCLLDADRTDTADFEKPDIAVMRLNGQYPSWDNFLYLLEKRLALFVTGNIVDEIRNDVSTKCNNRGTDKQGIFSLTVPTGGGKTLASLRFALQHARKHKLDRIFYIIPYTSIIDQNVREVQNIFHPLSDKYGIELVLEHHSNLTPENNTEQETTIQKLLSENWDAPIVFTTSVQFLESLFSGGTRSARRMHQLANSVIIFDEIQTIPVKTVHLFNNALNFLTDVCKSTVLLCTATQPLLHKVDRNKGSIALLPDNEVIPNVSTLFERLKRVEVIDRTRAEGWSSNDIANLVKKELEEIRTVLVVVNTKKSAKELYLLCQDSGAAVFHLSTDMCSAHRIEVLDMIRHKIEPENTTEKIVCISTQLIEAGVDIDFDAVIRYLAGLDSIAQAAGRCNRNGRKDIGKVSIVNHSTENIDQLKEIKIAQTTTTRVLQEYKDCPKSFGNSLLSPQTIERYFEYYFFNRMDLMSYPVSSNNNVQEDSLLEMLSRNERAKNIFRNTAMPLPQSFASAGRLFKAIDSHTQGIIVPYKGGKEIIVELCASQDISKEFDLIKKAQRFSVNCYTQTLDLLAREGAIYNIQDSGIFYLDDKYYSQLVGLSLVPLEVISDSSFIC